MHEKKLKLLLMIDEAGIGGGQQHILWLADLLDRRRFDVAVACEGNGYLVDKLRDRNIPVHPLAMTNRMSLRSIIECRKLFRLFCPDIVHTHGGTAGFLGRISSLFGASKRVVHTYHGIHYLHYKNPVQRIAFKLVDRALLRLTDWVICVAQHDLELGVKAGVVDPEKASVIWNGIDVAAYAIPPRPKKGSAPIVGTIGRLHYQKGQIYLLEAARMILEKEPDAKFEIVGDGELRPLLERKADELGISGSVRFLGMRTDIPDVLSRMSIFVLSSLWEGLPLVLLEAMAARKPIVSTNVDGVTEILEDQQNAILVPPGEPGPIADAVLALLHDAGKSQRLANHAFETVSSKFDVRTMVMKTEQVYEEIA